MAEKDTPVSALDREVSSVKGVGPKRAAALGRLGITTVRDLLFHLPRGYEDRRRPRPIAGLQVGDRAVVSGQVTFVEFRPTRSYARGVLDVRIEDGTGQLSLTWFNARPGWEQDFTIGQTITAFGQVSFFKGPQIVAPDYRRGEGAGESDKFGRILPIYPATEAVTQSILRQVTRAALEQAADEVADIFPQAFADEQGFPPPGRALRDVHFPPSPEAAEAARRRLVYEELFVFQTALALRRARMQQATGVSLRVGPNVDRRIRNLFSFDFTDAQNKVIEEVAADMRSLAPMNRLLQGDVGCGKTAVAVYAMLAALAESGKGYQAAVMAPTEILAEQHYLTLQSLLGRARVRTGLMTASAGTAARKENLRRLAAGEVDLVVGTHALIQPDVEFRNLALVVVDEQHRFGVEQRLALRRKGPPPDVLIMTATPIPRTLALAYFGDMDVSVIHEMPPGRRPVGTALYMPADWGRAFEDARSELEAGRQVFVVYPLVEENAELDLTSAKEGYAQLSRDIFPGFKCCLLHGQMPSREKQAAMEGFRDGRYQVMAATTVVEVGIHVPKATVMIIQHAERLGLAQLHQLRGRIGRGEHPGKCFLLAEPSSPEARQRLEVLTQTNDGFRIAEEDLRIRGPGQFFGTQQSGLPEFRCYDFSDTSVLEQAREDAFGLVEGDPELSRPEHALLRERVMEDYGKRFAFAEVG